MNNKKIMLLNIKILMVFFLLSFVLLLYKLNKYSRIILIEASDIILENVELNEKYRQPSPVLVNYFSNLLNKRPNLLTYPLFMTTSYIYNKKEGINEDSSELERIKQTIELKKTSMSLALIVFFIISIEWNNLDVFLSTYQKGFSFTLPLGIHSGIILAYDHLSIPFILLLSFVFPIVFMSNWTTVNVGEMKYYLTTILSSHYFLIIVFLVIDILMFYISFEIILPFFFILLGMFGGIQKFRAMYYLFLYTLWGSLFMLLEFLTKIGENGTGVMGLLEDLQLSPTWSILGSVAIILAFSIKTPIVPFHLWLPLAHGDANVSGSIVLASIVLKMALYGFIRILIFILLLAFTAAQINMFFIFIFSLIFASTTTMRQNDLKVLVAYSSVAHMGSTLLGGFSNNHFGIFGSILFSIAHGVVSPALFIFVGALFYDRIGSRIMNYLKGLVLLYPIGVAMLLPVIFGNMGTPLTANFIAEFECILGTFIANKTMGMIAAISIILSACYSIFMYNRISTGSLSPYLETAPDTNKKEFSMLMPLILIMIILGITPYLISNPIDLGLSNFLLNGFDNPFMILVILFYLFFSLSSCVTLRNSFLFTLSILGAKISLFLNQFNKPLLFIWSCLYCIKNNNKDNDDDNNNNLSYEYISSYNSRKVVSISEPISVESRQNFSHSNIRDFSEDLSRTDGDLLKINSEVFNLIQRIEEEYKGVKNSGNEITKNSYEEAEGISEQGSGSHKLDKVNDSDYEMFQWDLGDSKLILKPYLNWQSILENGIMNEVREIETDNFSPVLYYSHPSYPIVNILESMIEKYSKMATWLDIESDIKLINEILVHPTKTYSWTTDFIFDVCYRIAVLDLFIIKIIGCGAAFLITVFIINGLYKLVTKLKFKWLDIEDKGYIGIIWNYIHFIKKEDENREFIRSQAPSPETQPGTSREESRTPKDKPNDNGEGYSLDRKGSNKDGDKSPSEENGSDKLPKSGEESKSLEYEYSEDKKYVRKNKPREETFPFSPPAKYVEWKNTINALKEANVSPDTPDTPPTSPKISRHGLSYGRIKTSHTMSPMENCPTQK
jgi:NADH-ubiquinone oxidoreductase chain 4